MAKYWLCIKVFGQIQTGWKFSKQEYPGTWTSFQPVKITKQTHSHFVWNKSHSICSLNTVQNGNGWLMSSQGHSGVSLEYRRVQKDHLRCKSIHSWIKCKSKNYVQSVEKVMEVWLREMSWWRKTLFVCFTCDFQIIFFTEKLWQ